MCEIGPIQPRQGDFIHPSRRIFRPHVVQGDRKHQSTIQGSSNRQSSFQNSRGVFSRYSLKLWEQTIRHQCNRPNTNTSEHRQSDRTNNTRKSQVRARAQQHCMEDCSFHRSKRVCFVCGSHTYGNDYSKSLESSSDQSRLFHSHVHQLGSSDQVLENSRKE